MPHLLAGRLAMITGAQVTNVPFAGSGPAIAQVLGGQLAGMSSPLGDWVQHYKGGKVRVLATSGPERSPYTPDVATYRAGQTPRHRAELQGRLLILPAGSTTDPTSHA